LLELLAKRGFWDLQFAKEENTCKQEMIRQYCISAL
jgi:hypothetical protein